MYVDGIVKRLRAANIDTQGEARQEPVVADSIVHAADVAGADLIVLSTRALTGPSRALLGSTADAVVRAAHCPVLLIHRTRATHDAPVAFAPDAAAVSGGAARIPSRLAGSDRMVFGWS